MLYSLIYNPKKALHVGLFLGAVLFAGCTQNSTNNQNLDGKKLLKQNCSACHNLDMPPKTFRDEKAPPMMAVSFHILDAIKATTPADRVPNAVEFVVDFTQNPSASKSFCDKTSLKSYGLMPSLKGKVSEEELRAIAEYLFTHYTKENLLDQMKRAKKIKKMPKGELLASEHGCLACHGIKIKKVGPSFEQVAKNIDLQEIQNSIKNGSKGKWKQSRNIPMPAFRKLSQTDIKYIAKWIKEKNN